VGPILCTYDDTLKKRSPVVPYKFERQIGIFRIWICGGCPTSVRVQELGEIWTRTVVLPRGRTSTLSALTRPMAMSTMFGRGRRNRSSTAVSVVETPPSPLRCTLLALQLDVFSPSKKGTFQRGINRNNGGIMMQCSLLPSSLSLHMLALDGGWPTTDPHRTTSRHLSCTS